MVRSSDSDNFYLFTRLFSVEGSENYLVFNVWKQPNRSKKGRETDLDVKFTIPPGFHLVEL